MNAARLSAQSIVNLRCSLGLTQAQLARLVGATERSIRRWEQGTGDPKGAHAAVLSALQVSVHANKTRARHVVDAYPDLAALIQRSMDPSESIPIVPNVRPFACTVYVEDGLERVQSSSFDARFNDFVYVSLSEWLPTSPAYTIEGVWTPTTRTFEAHTVVVAEWGRCAKCWALEWLVAAQANVIGFDVKSSVVITGPQRTEHLTA